MKKRTVGFVVLSIFVVAVVYRYGIASHGRGPAVCRGRYDCETDYALMQKNNNDCNEACSKKSNWGAYCAENKKRCMNDCALKKLMGKSDSVVQECRAACTEENSKCITSYEEDLVKCQGVCAEKYKKAKIEFSKVYK